MFFTRLATILAWCTFIYGGSYTAYVFSFYVRKFNATGELMSEKGSANLAIGFKLMIFGILLGSVLEFSKRNFSAKT